MVTPKETYCNVDAVPVLFEVKETFLNNSLCFGYKPLQKQTNKKLDPEFNCSKYSKNNMIIPVKPVFTPLHCKYYTVYVWKGCYRKKKYESLLYNMMYNLNR